MFESVLSTPLDVCNSVTAEKMKFSMKAFFNKCDQIRRKLRIWLHLLKKSCMENFIFCAVSKFHYVRKCQLKGYTRASSPANIYLVKVNNRKTRKRASQLWMKKGQKFNLAVLKDIFRTD